MAVREIARRTLAVLVSAAMTVGLMPAIAFAANDEPGSTAKSLQFEEIKDAKTLAGAKFVVEEDEDEDENKAEAHYNDGDVVRVSIVMKDPGAIDAGFNIDGVAKDRAAASYRDRLETKQDALVESLQKSVDHKIVVKRNLTLAADIVSAEVTYGDIEAIEQSSEVLGVYVENLYAPAVVDKEETSDPNMATSSAQVGSATAYSAGYTGAGSRVAVIDTGIDTDHQSFDAGGLEYSFKMNADKAGKTTSSYINSLDLLDKEEESAVLSQLNVSKNITSDDLYVNAKIPFAYNYIDKDLDITHDNDSQGEHGSHVEGIAAANAYIPDGNGGFASALDTVSVQGVAPDAQIIAMKVFGKAGGAYDSDYMAAIEDAIVLKADSINLSLGSATAGLNANTNDVYQAIFDNLDKCGTVVSISAGNSYNWSHRTKSDGGRLYADDINFDTVGSPGSYTNSLAVASAQNSGRTGSCFYVGDHPVYYTETNYSNEPMATIAGKHEFVMIPGDGLDAEFAAVADQLQGKVAFCGIGTNKFAEKANNAVKYGAIATVVYNNVNSSAYRMGLSAYTGTAPCVSISMKDWKAILEEATEVKDDEGKTLYWTGRMDVSGSLDIVHGDPADTTMSEFSSWGMPGVTLKPEITAPGGNIYSVDGSKEGGKAYENMSGTSMAAPQVTGMAALVAQYVRESGLAAKTGKSVRQLAQSLLMSTAEPLDNPEADGQYYPVLEQGAGLANVGDAVTATSYIMMDEDATKSAADGKIKVELGMDKEKSGSYDFGFSINNIVETDTHYTLSGDLFTQAIVNDGYDFLDTTTTPLAVDLSFDIDGKTFRPTSAVACDLNNDGATNAEDAQLILDKAAGFDRNLGDMADVDKDGKVTTHDAYMILNNLQTQQITVPAGKSVAVKAHAVLTDEAKKLLNENYANGAYIEGYVYANPQENEQGAIEDATHSIPLIGFYGDMSDASMYDISSYADRMYGDDRPTYFGRENNNNYFNGLTVNRGTGNRVYWVTGNPYAVEDAYPADKAAMNGSDTLNYYSNIVTRNAAARMLVVTDSQGKVLYTGDYQSNLYGAFYHSFYGWMTPDKNYTINATPQSFGAKEGDTINVSVVTVPEYYNELKGGMNREKLLEMVQNQELGKGCYLTTTLRIDNTAPTISYISKDINTGNYLVTARDNQYVAAVKVANRAGSKSYKTVVPDQGREGDSVTVDLGDLSDVKLPNYWSIVVCDYAGNETAYQLITDPSIDESVGQMYGFTYQNLTGQGSGNRFLTVDPESVWYYGAAADRHGGFDLAGNVPDKMTAAEYVGGYVFMAGANQHMYIAPVSNIENALDGGYFGDTAAKIIDMAYDYTTDTLYALGTNEAGSPVSQQYDGQNEIYKVNLETCELELAYTVKPQISEAGEHITNENTLNHVREFDTLAIDDDGNFYSVTYGLYSHPYENSYLHKYNPANDADENGVIVSNPVDPSTTGQTSVASDNYYGGAMTWDHDNDILYWSNGWSSTASTPALRVVNTETGKATRANPDFAGSYNSSYASRLPYSSGAGGCMTGLFVVPAKTDALNLSAATASAISVNKTSLDMLAGSSTELSATVLPWCLNDMSVTWESSDDSIVNVNATGGVHAVKGGTATITVTPNANPEIHATCTVNVRDVTPMKLTALATDRAQSDEGTGKVKWVDFSTGDMNTIVDVRDSDRDYIGASEGMTTNGPKIVAHAQKKDEDGTVTSDHMYLVDPDTFKSEDLGTVPANWTESEVAPMQIDEDGDEIFGFYLLPYMSGNIPKMKIMNTDGKQRADVGLSGNYTTPIVAIAYAGYDPEYNIVSSTGYVTGKKPTEKFYYLLADGRIIQWNYYLSQKSRDSYLVNSTGTAISTPAIVSDNLYKSDGSNDISMIWNEADQALLISFTEEGTTKFYEVDPVTGLYTFVGTLGGEVEKVTDLYQYERVTDQTVWITSKAHEVFEKEQIQLSARVLPEKYADKVVWSSSDENIATVDAETGLVTGTGDGDVTITATSVDADENGNHAYATVNVHVTGLARVSGVTVRAQVTQTSADEEGEEVSTTSWSDINAGEVSDGLSNAAATDATLYGGGMLADGKYYGTDAAYTPTTMTPEVNLYQVDPATGKATKGGALAEDQGFQAAASVPKATYTVVDKDGNEKLVTAFGKDFAITRNKASHLGRSLYMIDDWETGAMTRIGTATNANAGFLGAATGLQYYMTDYDDNGVPKAYFLVGYYTGGAYLYYVMPKYDPETDTVSYVFGNDSVAFYISGSLVGSNLSNMGPQPFVYVKSDKDEGVIVGRYADGDTALYWFDFNKSTNPDFAKPVPGMTGANRPTYVAQKMGVLKGVTKLEGLHVVNSAEQPSQPPFGIANLFTGSTQWLSGAVEIADEGDQAAQATTNVKVEDGVVTIKVVEDQEVTNGLLKISYDPKVLEYKSLESGAQHAVLTDADTGEVNFAYAYKEPQAAGATVATLTFAYAQDTAVDTDVVLSTRQRNDSVDLADESRTVNVKDEASIKEDADKEAAAAVEKQISELSGQVESDEDAKAVAEVQDAYDALTDEQKAFVSDDAKAKLDAAIAAAKAYEEAKQADADAVKAVEKMIEELPAQITTEEQKSAVDAAQAAYDALGDGLKALVSDKHVALLDAAQAKKSLAEANESLEATQKELADTRAELEAKTQELEQANARVAELAAQLEEANKALVQSGEENEGLKAQVADLQQQLAEAQEQAEKAASDLADAQAAADEAAKKAEKDLADAVAAQKAADDEEAAKAAAQAAAQLQEALDALAQADKAAQEAASAQSALQDNVAALTAQLAAVQAQLDDAKAKAATAPKAGESVIAGHGATKAVYTVKKAAKGKDAGTVVYTRTMVPANAAKASVPATVEIVGLSYKVIGVDKAAFFEMTKLKTVAVGDNVTTIDSNAFNGCTKLAGITGAKNVKVIGKQAFANCKKLKKITLGTKLAKIGANAFSGCKKLKTLTIKSKKLKKGTVKKSLKGSKIKTVKVPKAKKKAYKKIFAKKVCGKKVKVK